MVPATASSPMLPSVCVEGQYQTVGRENYDAIQTGLVGTLKLTLRKIGSEGIIVYDCFRNTDTFSFRMQYLDYADAAIIEHLSHFRSNSKRVGILVLVPARRGVGRYRPQVNEDR